MKIKLNKKTTLICLILVCVLSIGILTACDELQGFDMTGRVSVVYDAMGGMMDYQPTRTLLALPGSLLAPPIGGASGYGTNLQEAKKPGFILLGWYTRIVAENYIADTEGSFVDYFEFTASETGEYVGLPFYKENSEGTYVAKKLDTFEVDGAINYELYEADLDKEHINTEGETVSTIYIEEDYVFASNGKLQRYMFYYLYEDFDATNPDHAGNPRFSGDPEYVAYDSENPNHVGLDRYEGDFEFDENDKWDFKTDKVGTEGFTLYARWEKQLRIVWSGTNIVYKDGDVGITINRGETIPKTSVIPTKSGHTFTYWATEDGTRWDFNTDVFPTNKSINTLTLYPQFVEGTYTRITNVTTLRAVGTKLSGNYILDADIDLKGAITQPLGMSTTDSVAPFTGKFLGNGFTIKNFVVDAKKVGSISTPGSFGLFSAISGATIKDLSVEFSVVVAANSVGPVQIGGLAGAAEGNNVIDNCNIKVSMTSTTSTGTIYYGDVIGVYVGAATATITATVVDNTYNFAVPGLTVKSTETIT